jgi:hypothetical protein
VPTSHKQAEDTTVDPRAAAMDQTIRELQKQLAESLTRLRADGPVPPRSPRLVELLRKRLGMAATDGRENPRQQLDRPSCRAAQTPAQDLFGKTMWDAFRNGLAASVTLDGGPALAHARRRAALSSAEAMRTDLRRLTLDQRSSVAHFMDKGLPTAALLAALRNHPAYSADAFAALQGSPALRDDLMNDMRDLVRRSASHAPDDKTTSD